MKDQLARTGDKVEKIEIAKHAVDKTDYSDNNISPLLADGSLYCSFIQTHV